MPPMIHWKLNCFMDTYSSSSACQSTGANHSGVKWSLSDSICPTPTTFSVTQMGVRKSRREIIGQNLNLVVEILWSELQRLKTRSWIPSTDQEIGPLCLWSPVPAKLSEKVHNTPRTMVQCGCRMTSSVSKIFKFRTELDMNKYAACLMRYLSKRRDSLIWHTYWKRQQHTSNKCITKPLSRLAVLCQLRRVLHMSWKDGLSQ